MPLLERLRRSLGAEDGLLIGMDLVKPIATLEAAYDDALGVTAAFNRNVLLHINRILGSDFRLEDWRHVALFNTQASRIEMHLEALSEVRVTWPGGERLFAAHERMHTENSYKYTPESARLIATSGACGAAAVDRSDELFCVDLRYIYSVGVGACPTRYVYRARHASPTIIR